MEPVAVHPGTGADLAELAEVAGRTFPLACPPSVSAEDIAAFIDDTLSADRFRDYLADPDRIVLVARHDARIAGYAMVVRGASDDAAVQRAVPLRPAVEVSKLYVLPEQHGTGVAGALMSTALQRAAELGAACLWLGVNQQNQRAQRFYAKHGFTVGGTKTFRVGARTEHDYVLVRPL